MWSGKGNDVIENYQIIELKVMTDVNKPFQIAIDGPVAAGKSTAAQRLAVSLGFVYVDTGAMYRAVTLIAIERDISLDDEPGLIRLVDMIEIDVRPPNESELDGRTSTVLVDGRDVSWEIREEQVSRMVARVAAMPRVRDALVPKQQKIANQRNVVMEGRDITYVVLPNAQLKIFLDADEEVRAQRYYHKMRGQGARITREEAQRSLRERDELDRNREASPLRLVEGVWHFDSSDLSVDEVVEKIASRTEEMMK